MTTVTAQQLSNAAIAHARDDEIPAGAPDLAEAALLFAADQLRQTNEIGSAHAATLVESLVDTPETRAALGRPDRNREAEPCPDGECTHAFDDWPADSVTRTDEQIDQCPTCGWTIYDKHSR
jgi:hypothetical protein